MQESYDFVVVGSGAGSLCAALVLRQAGQSVIVLEKTDLLGGTTATSGGVMWIPDNPVMQREGITDSQEQALAYLDAVVGDDADAPGASRARRQAYVEQAPRMVQFLLDQGIRLRRVPSWPDYCDAPGESVPGRTVVSELFDLNQLGVWKSKLRPGFLPLAAYLEEAMELPNMKRSGNSKKVLFRILGRTLFNRLRGRHLATAGQALQAQLLHAALQAGVEVRTGSGVRQLLMDADRVTGVAVESDGREVQIEARNGVLINAGGFAHNQAMLDRYIPGTSSDWSLTAPGDTGEMIEEAMRIGAAVAQMETRVGNPMAFPPSKDKAPVVVHGDLAKPHSILVDQSARRYLCEAASYVAICQDMLARHREIPAIPSWLIMDSRYLDTYMLAGSMPGRKKPKAWTEQGFLRSGDTLAELASACDLPAEALQATVERFNGFARSGRDEDFQRGDHVYGRWLGDSLDEASPTLGTVEQGPFYAIQVYPGDVSTYGGLVTDEHARVLREDGTAIAGLYATGTSTASVMGRGCPGAGASIGPSLTWAYVAARHTVGDSTGSESPN